jgi:rhamnosyltransferase
MSSASVVIPTKNGEQTIKAVLDAIFRQGNPEVIIIDSGSRDRTITIARNYPVRIIEIPAREFNHGRTRNSGVQEAQGEFVVLITQDAEPTDEQWLSSMLRNFSDPEVAGVYCRQIPREDADPVTKRRLNEWLTGRKERSEASINDRTGYEGLPAMEKYLFCNFDNVCSCIRKSVWEKIPFEETYFAEDIGWSKKVLEAGFAIVYEPEAAVYHSHNRSAWHEYQRTYICHRRLYHLFGLQTIPTFRDACRATVTNITMEGTYIWRAECALPRKIPLLLKLPFLSLCSVFGQYLGARDEKRRMKGWE